MSPKQKEGASRKHRRDGAKQLVALLDAGGVPAWATGPSGEFVLKNQSVCKLCADRCGEPSLFQGCFAAVFEHDDIPALRALSASVSMAGLPSSAPVRLRATRAPVRANLLRLGDEDAPLLVGALFAEAPAVHVGVDGGSRSREVVESQSELIGRFKPDGTITLVNQAVCAFLGRDERDLVGSKIQEFLDPDAAAEMASALEGLTPHQAFVQLTQRLVGPHGPRWFRWNNRALFDDAGAIVAFQGVGRDVTREVERAAHLERDIEHKTTLVREVYHRVKNHIHIVSSLLGVALESIKDTQAATKLLLTRSRVDALCLVHELLCEAPDASNADGGAYVRLLVNRLRDLHGSGVDVHVEGTPPVLSPEDLTTLGLVMSELLSNAFVHAFPGAGAGQVRVAIESGADGGYMLLVEDSGVGMPVQPGLARPAYSGLSLVQSLVAHTGGRLEQVEVPRGTRFVVTWPCRSR